MRSGDAHGRRISRAAGRDGPLLRRSERRDARNRRSARRVLRTALRRRRDRQRKDRAGARGGRTPRHARRHLRGRHETVGQQGSVRAAPRGARTCANTDRRRSCDRPWRADRRSARPAAGHRARRRNAERQRGDDGASMPASAALRCGGDLRLRPRSTARLLLRSRPQPAKRSKPCVRSHLPI